MRSAPPGLHLPLRRLVLCLDCEETFDIGYRACPVCGSETWTPLARFLEIAPVEPVRRVLTGISEAARRGEDPTSSPHQLLIVSRHQPVLYARLRRAFSGDPRVNVILDRRLGERRRGQSARGTERRRGDRRKQPSIDDQLGSLGWSLVLLDLPTPPRPDEGAEPGLPVSEIPSLLDRRRR